MPGTQHAHTAHIAYPYAVPHPQYVFNQAPPSLSLHLHPSFTQNERLLDQVNPSQSSLPQTAPSSQLATHLLLQTQSSHGLIDLSTPGPSPLICLLIGTAPIRPLLPHAAHPIPQFPLYCPLHCPYLNQDNSSSTVLYHGGIFEKSVLSLKRFKWLYIYKVR